VLSERATGSSGHTFRSVQHWTPGNEVWAKTGLVKAATTGAASRLDGLLNGCRKVVGAAQIAGCEVVWSQVFGGPQDSLFQAGSISKSVTAALTLELTKERGIDLDSQVSDHLHSWQLPVGSKVTIRQLLAHTSGASTRYFPGYQQGSQVPTVLQVLDGSFPAKTASVTFDPDLRGRFHYSGGGYVILQQLIADVTGCDFAESARTLILDPLEMSQSTFEQPLPDELRTSAARSDWRTYPEATAAGLWTTPRDLALYVSALLTAAIGLPTPLAPTTAAAMLHRHATLPAKGDWNLLPLLGIRPPTHFGLGLFLHGDDRFSHVGGASSFSSMMTASIDDLSGAVVMYAGNVAPFPFRVLREMSRQYGWQDFEVHSWKRISMLPGLRRFGRSGAAGSTP
jgi:CubicO group peptidase (beta-lactamase class C family)